MIDTKLNRANQRIAEAVIEATLALADGWQPEEDIPVVLGALRLIGGQTVHIDDVIQDIDASRRCLTVGRHNVYDDRFKVRERAVRRALAAQIEAAAGGNQTAAEMAVMAHR